MYYVTGVSFFICIVLFIKGRRTQDTHWSYFTSALSWHCSDWGFTHVSTNIIYYKGKYVEHYLYIDLNKNRMTCLNTKTKSLNAIKQSIHLHTCMVNKQKKTVTHGFRLCHVPVSKHTHTHACKQAVEESVCAEHAQTMLPRDIFLDKHTTRSAQFFLNSHTDKFLCLHYFFLI